MTDRIAGDLFSWKKKRTNGKISIVKRTTVLFENIPFVCVCIQFTMKFIKDTLFDLKHENFLLRRYGLIYHITFSNG